MTDYRELRQGQYLLVEQTLPAFGPRVAQTSKWVGKVTCCDAKFLKLKHAGVEMVVPQQGEETFTVLTKADYEKDYVPDQAKIKGKPRKRKA